LAFLQRSTQGRRADPTVARRQEAAQRIDHDAEAGLSGRGGEILSGCRGDRFCDGHWGVMTEDGQMLCLL